MLSQRCSRSSLLCLDQEHLGLSSGSIVLKFDSTYRVRAVFEEDLAL